MAGLNWKFNFRKFCLLDRENSKRLGHKEQERGKNVKMMEKCPNDGKVCMQSHSLPVLVLPTISATMGPVVLLVGIWVFPSITWGPTCVFIPCLYPALRYFFSHLCSAGHHELEETSLHSPLQLPHIHLWRVTAHELLGVSKISSSSVQYSDCHHTSMFSMFFISVHVQSFPKGTGLSSRTSLNEVVWFICWPFLVLFFKFLHAVISIVIEHKQVLPDLQLN